MKKRIFIPNRENQLLSYEEMAAAALLFACNFKLDPNRLDGNIQLRDGSPEDDLSVNLTDESYPEKGQFVGTTVIENPTSHIPIRTGVFNAIGSYYRTKMTNRIPAWEEFVDCIPIALDAFIKAAFHVDYHEWYEQVCSSLTIPDLIKLKEEFKNNKQLVLNGSSLINRDEGIGHGENLFGTIIMFFLAIFSDYIQGNDGTINCSIDDFYDIWLTVIREEENSHGRTSNQNKN